MEKHFSIQKADCVESRKWKEKRKKKKITQKRSTHYLILNSTKYMKTKQNEL